MFKTILVCSDGSASALKAARKAAEIALQADACLLLLHVANTATLPSSYMVSWQMESRELEDAQAKAEQEAVLTDTVEMLRESGARYQVLFEQGHPAAQIVRVAEREGADLIVMGSRGLNALKSILLGSVSSHVIHHAPCSVLIIR